MVKNKKRKTQRNTYKKQTSKHKKSNSKKVKKANSNYYKHYVNTHNGTTSNKKVASNKNNNNTNKADKINKDNNTQSIDCNTDINTKIENNNIKSENKAENNIKTDYTKADDNEQTKVKTTKKDYIYTIIKYSSVAFISSLLTFSLTKNTMNKTNLIQSDNPSISMMSNINPTNLINKLDEKNLFDTNNSYSLDLEFDETFENVREIITDIDTRIYSGNDKLQDIFIIKSTETKKIEKELQNYKKLLINNYKGDNINAKIAKEAIIKSYKDITYFIASDNMNKINEVIEKELQK